MTRYSRVVLILLTCFAMAVTHGCINTSSDQTIEHSAGTSDAPVRTYSGREFGDYQLDGMINKCIYPGSTYMGNAEVQNIETGDIFSKMVGIASFYTDDPLFKIIIFYKAQGFMLVNSAEVEEGSAELMKYENTEGDLGVGPQYEITAVRDAVIIKETGESKTGIIITVSYPTHPVKTK